MRFGERATLRIVNLFATWAFLIVNLLGWTALYVAYAENGWQQGAIVWALSEWPVLVDILILSATMVLTRQQMNTSERQTRLIEAVSELTEGITQSLSGVQGVLTAHTASLDAFSKEFSHLRRELSRMRKYDRDDARDIDSILAKVESLTARQEHVSGMIEAVVLTMGARRCEGEKDEEGGEGSA